MKPGKEYEFEVRKSDTVKDLRARILEEVKKVPGRDYVEGRHLRLLHMGREMEDGPEEPGKEHLVFLYRICDGSLVILHVRPKEVDEPVAQEDSQKPTTETSSSASASSSPAPAPFVVPPIEQEHLDKALPVSLVTERTKVKLLCTPETGDDLLPHEEGIPLGVVSRTRRVFHLDADTVAKFQDTNGKFAYICFDLKGADLPNPDGVDTHCVMRRRKELPTTGNHLALWLIYQNVELDKKTSLGLPVGRAGGKKAAVAAKASASAGKENGTAAAGSAAAEKAEGSTVLAFRLKRPEDLEEGYYTLGVVDPSAPDEPCEVCRSHDDPEKTLICDQCGEGYHIYCLTPPLAQVPPDDVDWYCPNCFNDPEAVKAKMSDTKRGQALGAKKKGWGGGMANAGLKAKCTIVEKDFSGQVPGTWVGQTWPMRIDCNSAGVHREMIAGIAGNVNLGKAVSLVVSGGYEDDDDMGEQFKYSGSGGRNLKDGNKRVAGQSSDQIWSSRNLALAMSCVGFKHKCNKDFKGHVCKECQERWRDGKPIRVVRSNKAKEYGPQSKTKLYRYDGLYKVADYWTEKGKSGFNVCRYLLRRDDPAPAPWTAAGKAYIKKMLSGANQAKEEKLKMRKIRVLIERDTLNKRTWDNLVPQIDTTTLGKFLEEVDREFPCMICQTRVDIPFTFPCGHNICQDCFKHFKTKAEKKECGMCRAEVTADFIKTAKYNEYLVDILATLFPNFQLPPGHKVHEVHVEPCAGEEEEPMEVEADEDDKDEQEVVKAAAAKKRKAAAPAATKKRAAPAAKKRAAPSSRKGKEKRFDSDDDGDEEEEIVVDGESGDEAEEEDERKPAKRVTRAKQATATTAAKRKRGDVAAVVVGDDDEDADAFQPVAKKKRTSVEGSASSRRQSAPKSEPEEMVVVDDGDDDDPLLNVAVAQTKQTTKMKKKQAATVAVDDEDDSDDFVDTPSKSKSKKEQDIGTDDDDGAVDEKDIGTGWDLWLEDGLPCRELTNFALLWKTRSFVDMEKIGDGLSVRATGSLVAPPESANTGAELKVRLPGIMEWTLDYTNACLWLRTPLAWYKLAKPLPEYAPHFEEANAKFEICNHLTTILEDDDNTAIDFDATVAKMKEASGGKYDEQHVLKRAAFIEEKMLQFPEAEATKKRFIRQMKSKAGSGSSSSRRPAANTKKKGSSTATATKKSATSTKKANQTPVEPAQPNDKKKTLDHFFKPRA